MPKGGARPGAGRKAGTPNKRTAETQAAVEASGITPLDYMLSVMRNDGNPSDMRLDAAHKAAPFVHPRLAAIEHSGGIAHSHEAALDELDEPEGTGDKDKAA